MNSVPIEPSKQCRQAGLKSLAQLVQESPVPKSTLLDWARHKPAYFQMAINDVLYRINNREDL